jgi:hypothetical protein
MAQTTYVIMLDSYLEVYPHFWPISAQSDDINVLHHLSQHDGNPAIIPRSEASMTLLENKSLINSQTGQVNTGGIYRMSSV